MEAPERTALYRLHDLDGHLLYVGITDNLERRWKDHQYTKSWWKKVARKDVEWFGSRKAAADAEAAEIREKRPPFNRLHASWPTDGNSLLPPESIGMSELRKHGAEAIDKAINGTPILITRRWEPLAVIYPYWVVDHVEASVDLPSPAGAVEEPEADETIRVPRDEPELAASILAEHMRADDLLRLAQALVTEIAKK